MYLVSCPAHIPTAVFDDRADAYQYLQRQNNISEKYVFLQDITDTLEEVYMDAYRDEPRKTLGYVRSGILLNPER
jgi:hypothetical protein